MFRRVLVANRGEIARRIIRTLNQMNIESYVVYSEADQDISYLNEASKKICIGPAAAKKSYLCEEAILQAALQNNCEAIHPGFGFLSENAIFAARCADQKLTFIGPSPKHISLMGDKARARETMESLGVPTLPGSKGLVKNKDELKELAKKIGYPLLIKARAGGGGKGMRKVESQDELMSAFEDARREAQSAFNDDQIYVEKFLQGARHIEFQILGDSYQNIVCLGERECSIQRKNQKLVEEAPAQNFDQKIKEDITQKIIIALKKMSYQNAGTMEFLLDQDQNLFFMEMNTRIQVEHPVTELVYGVDIVEWQLRVACNEKLGDELFHLKPKGAAIECRINAEDPKNNFLPSPGEIKEWRLPKNDPKGPVRVDSHAEKSFKVSPFYDSLLAKIITHGSDRSEALARMKKALNETVINGVKTTKEFHQALLNNQDFLRGAYDCSFLPQHFEKIIDEIK